MNSPSRVVELALGDVLKQLEVLHKTMDGRETANPPRNLVIAQVYTVQFN